MSQSQVIDLAVSQVETASISETASRMKKEAARFSHKWDAQMPIPPDRLEDDAIIFLAKRKQTMMTALRITALEDGIATGDTLSGQRKADLIFKISYKQGGVIKA